MMDIPRQFLSICQGKFLLCTATELTTLVSFLHYLSHLLEFLGFQVLFICEIFFTPLFVLTWNSLCAQIVLIRNLLNSYQTISIFILIIGVETAQYVEYSRQDQTAHNNQKCFHYSSDSCVSSSSSFFTSPSVTSALPIFTFALLPSLRAYIPAASAG